MMKTRINYINDYYKKRFGKRTLKIGIDGSFTCPNRDGTCGTAGCAFCSERGSGEHLTNGSIRNQIEKYFSSYKAMRADQFILYFQNYSNTYDTIENLKSKYDESILAAQEIIGTNHPTKKIVGLSISTRPDCITEEVCKLLDSYQKELFVSIELGLQTANDNIRNQMNCGYTAQDFSKAVKLLKEHSLEVVVHLMVGLPHETQEDIVNTVNFINQQDIQGVKIHSTYIVKDTALETLFLQKKYIPLTLEEYIDKAVFIITHLRKDIVIHRISGDAPKDLLVAPDWNAHKKWIMNGIWQRLENDDLWQGMQYYGHP